MCVNLSRGLEDSGPGAQRRYTAPSEANPRPRCGCCCAQGLRPLAYSVARAGVRDDRPQPAGRNAISDAEHELYRVLCLCNEVVAVSGHRRQPLFALPDLLALRRLLQQPAEHQVLARSRPGGPPSREQVGAPPPNQRARGVGRGDRLAEDPHLWAAPRAAPGNWHAAGAASMGRQVGWTQLCGPMEPRVHRGALSPTGPAHPYWHCAWLTAPAWFWQASVLDMSPTYQGERRLRPSKPWHLK